VLLFVIIGLESSGLPVPGETALITASVLAVGGRFSIEAVIAVAAAGAIVGDNVGYWIGRTGGRRVFERIPWLSKLLAPSERFFDRHGGKAVFLARFVAGLRVTGAWLAGISKMEWRRFLLWNALGGIAWAVGVGLLAYFFGRAVTEAISRYGLIGAGAVALLGVLVFLGFHFLSRRAMPR
jgi:membrane protein DedA with SNARE-associated domain